MIFVLFAVFSKPAVNKNNQEKLEYDRILFVIDMPVPAVYLASAFVA